MRLSLRDYFVFSRRLVLTATATATAAEVLLNHRTRFIDCERPTVRFGPIQLGDCLLGAIVTHCHKIETPGSAGVTAGNDADRLHLAEAAEYVAFTAATSGHGNNKSLLVFALP